MEDAPVPAYEITTSDKLDTHFASLRLPRPDLLGGLRRSVQLHGVLHPLVVNRRADALVVLDGFKRLIVLDELAIAEVPVRVVELTAEQCKAALVTFNAPHRGLCELEEAWVVASLVREHGLKQVDVARLVGRHKSWVCRRLQLAERLDTGVVDDMRLGLVSPTVARELARLPRGNQAEVAESIRQHHLTSRQAAEVVSRVLESDDEDASGALLRDPVRYLSSGTRHVLVGERDPRLDEAADTVRKQLVRLDYELEATTRTVRRHLRQGLGDAGHSVLTERATAVLSALRVAREVLQALCETHREALPHA